MRMDAKSKFRQYHHILAMKSCPLKIYMLSPEKLCSWLGVLYNVPPNQLLSVREIIPITVSQRDNSNYCQSER